MYLESNNSKSNIKQVSIENFKGKFRVVFPRQYFGGKQIKRSINLEAVSDNQEQALKIARRFQEELQLGWLVDTSGALNEDRYQQVLEEYGLKARIRLVRVAPEDKNEGRAKSNPSILEVWEMYCEFSGHRLAKTTFVNSYRGAFLNYLNSAIENIGYDPDKIFNWLVKNRNAHDVKNLVSALERAYSYAIYKDAYVGKNPFLGLKETLVTKKRIKEIHQDKFNSEENELLDKKKAFSWEEAEIIMTAFKNHPKLYKYYPLIAFKFLTGCRNGEALALWWQDIKFDEERVIIRKSYDSKSRIFKPTKNETTRFFPMKKGSQLWNILSELKRGEDNHCVFSVRENGKPIHQVTLCEKWYGKISRGVRYVGLVKKLVEQGKVSKYLPVNNTRHTFVSHQIYDLGREPHIVNAWCEHSEQVSRKHYRDSSMFASDINPELSCVKQDTPQNNSQVDELKAIIEQQQAQINQLTILLEQFTVSERRE
ncbi:MAG: tyrosine-type recombinase/integrase [Rivularia sp. ALOHA_DT_140]|nr:tyrosine-type recombinase/integrase [Rivularia sp. ALOHA_DT_140]